MLLKITSAQKVRTERIKMTFLKNTKKVRKMLDNAGLNDCKIIVSNSLDEYTIDSLINQGGKIDSFGVGERLITAKSDPVFGAVYKICAVEENNEFVPRIKISENIEKITNPGIKKIWRIYDKESGKAIADLITNQDENPNDEAVYNYVDPAKPWKIRVFENFYAKEMQMKIFENGKCIYEKKKIDDIKNYVQKQLDEEIWEEEQRFVNPHKHYLDMSRAYYDMKMRLLDESKVD